MTSQISTRVATFAVSVLGIASFAIHLMPQEKAPSDEEWNAVGEWLASHVKSNDAVRFRPFWLSQGETSLQAFSGRNIPLVVRTDDGEGHISGRFNRVWVVTALSYDDPDGPEGAKLIETHTLAGGVRVHLFSMPKGRKTYDLVDRLGDALVSRQRHPQGSYEACVRRGDMHDCRGKPWENVRADWHHVGGSPRRCFVLHPYPDHGAVKILWRQVPLESQLVLFSGFTLEAARNEQGADCEVRVFVANELVAEWTEAKNGWGFVRHIIETESWSGRAADIEIEVSSRDEDFRDLCFDGHVVSR